MGGRPGDNHAARVKQGPEAFKGLFRSPPLNYGSGVECWIRDDQGINRNGFSLDNNQRVHVHALNIGSLDGQAAQPDQEVGQGIELNRLLAPKRLGHEMFEAHSLNHGARLRVGERGQGEDHIPERFGQNTAKTQEDARTELRVADHTGDQLSLPGNHLSNEQTDFPIFIPLSRPQLVRRPLNRLGRIETEADELPFGLVSNARPAQFHYNGKPYLRGRTTCLGRLLDKDFLRNRAPVSGNHTL